MKFFTNHHSVQSMMTLIWAHFSLEGSVEFKELFYIPGMLPFELSKDMFDGNTRNIRL